jgi:urease accessory protein
MPWSNGFAAACCSKTERVGRDGFLRLSFERRGARTVLAAARMTPPLQVMAPIELADGSAYVMLLNNGGGLIGGDRMRIEIALGAKSVARITTASAGKVYRTIGAAATHETAIRLAAEARLDYLPDHLIPHADANLIQRLTVAMERGSRAIIYGALAAGRIGRGERFAFRRIEDSIDVAYGDRPILRSRAILEPGTRPHDSIGVMGRFNYLASLVIAGESAEWNPIARSLGASLSAAGIDGGASPLPADGCVARWMTSDAETLRRTTAILYAEVARRAFDESLPRFRK